MQTHKHNGRLCPDVKAGPRTILGSNYASSKETDGLLAVASR